MSAKFITERLNYEVKGNNFAEFYVEVENPNNDSLRVAFTATHNVTLSRNHRDINKSAKVFNNFVVPEVPIGEVIEVTATLSGETLEAPETQILTFNVFAINHPPEVRIIVDKDSGRGTEGNPYVAPCGISLNLEIDEPDPGFSPYGWNWSAALVSGGLCSGQTNMMWNADVRPGLYQVGRVKQLSSYKIMHRLEDGANDVYAETIVWVEPAPDGCGGETPEPEPPDPEPEPEPEPGDRLIHCTDGPLRISSENFQEAKVAEDIYPVVNPIAGYTEWHTDMTKEEFLAEYPEEGEPEPPLEKSRQMCLSLHLGDPWQWHLDRARDLGVTWVNLWARNVQQAWWQDVTYGVLDRGMQLVVKVNALPASVLKEIITNTPACDHWIIGNEPRLQGQNDAGYLVNLCKELSEWDGRPEVLIGPSWAGRGSAELRQECLELGLRDWVDYESVNLYTDDWLMDDPKVWPSEFNSPTDLDYWLGRADASAWPVIPFFIQNTERNFTQPELCLYDEDLKPTASEAIYRAHYGIELGPDPPPPFPPEPDLYRYTSTLVKAGNGWDTGIGITSFEAADVYVSCFKDEELLASWSYTPDGQKYKEKLIYGDLKLDGANIVKVTSDRPVNVTSVVFGYGHMFTVPFEASNISK
jgi:hypothetical protein